MIEDVSLLSLALRLAVSLGIVLLLMFGAASLLRRRAGAGGMRLAALGRPGAGRTAPLAVVARQPLGRTAAVAVVRCGDRALVVGVTDTSVTMLAEADASVFDPRDAREEQDGSEADGPVPPGGAMRSGTTWTGVLEALRERTVRRS